MQNQIIQCKACGNGIAKSARFCPHCGYKNKRPFYTKWWFWLIVAFFVLGAVGNAGDDSGSSADVGETTTAATTAATTKKTTKVTTKATTKATTAATTKATTTAVAYVSYEEAAEALEPYLKDYFSFYEVESTDTGVVVKIAEDGLTADVIAFQNAGYDENHESWVELRESMESLCDDIYTFVKTLVGEDCIVSLLVLNDQNHDNVLLGITNGIVVYDVLAE